MNNSLRIAAALCVSLTISACVSTGAGEITLADRTSRLEAGKSTKAEVSSLLGFPARVTYGSKGEETWNYYYVTAYPRPVDFVPVAVAFSGDLNQTTRVLTVAFDRQGVVRTLHPGRTAGKAAVFPY